MKVYQFIPILGIFILPACQQDEPPPTAGDTSDRYSELMVDLITKAEQGDAHSQYLLGGDYEFGIGIIPQDYEEAMRWYRAAAEQGYAKAQNSLGAMYEYGDGVPQDYIRALMWFSLAASDLTGEYKERNVKSRDEIAEEMAAEEIAEAERLAREWKPKSSESQ